MKHTKAPWAWQKFGKNHFLTAQHGMREIILSGNKDKGGASYPSMNKDGILQPIDPEHPNAKLIAAAPELLEALQKVRKWYEEKGCEMLAPATPVCFSEALSAIQKATV